MKKLLLTLAIFSRAVLAQEFAAAAPAVQEEVAALPAFTVLSSVTQQVMKEEPAPLAGMVPVRKVVSETVQIVDDPQLIVKKPEEPKPKITRELTEEQRARWLAQRRKTITVNISATVYDHQRTLLRWYPHGHRAPAMTAWSAIDFNLFSGLYRFVHEDQEFILLLMHIENVDTQKRMLLAQRWGREYLPPEFPELPATGTPSFVVTQGDANDAEAMAPVTALHELYREDHVALHEAYTARLKAHAEREAWLRANPPQPQDVLIRVWKPQPLADSVTPSPAPPIVPLLENPVDQ